VIEIRPLEARERAVLRFGFRQLSADARYARYLAVKPELTEPDLARLLAIDHWHHEALVAWSKTPRRPVGVARYVRAPEFDTAEVAIEVADAWQRRGVARALVVELGRRAHAAGVRRFIAVTQRDNRAALALIRHVEVPDIAVDVVPLA
jgi:RimJ/RimL family protein N-acetyltransferase